jgi:hypothetical protein
VCIELQSDTRLVLTIEPVKTHEGRYGTVTTTIEVDPTKAGPAAAFIAARCREEGGRAVVSVGSKNALRKALARLGRRALPNVDVVITPYVYRQQALADLKVTVGAGGTVAAAAGHGTDRTQACYGRREHGRRRDGFIKAQGVRAPRTGAVEQAHALGTQRRDGAALRRTETPR